MSWLFRELRMRAFKVAREQPREDAESDEPQEHLPHAEISEAEREEAVRRYQRELAQKDQR
jgi:hypothetical protein